MKQNIIEQSHLDGYAWGGFPPFNLKFDPTEQKKSWKKTIRKW
jgi:hypothetical protein